MEKSQDISVSFERNQSAEEKKFARTKWLARTIMQGIILGTTRINELLVHDDLDNRSASELISRIQEFELFIQKYSPRIEERIEEWGILMDTEEEISREYTALALASQNVMAKSFDRLNQYLPDLHLGQSELTSLRKLVHDAEDDMTERKWGKLEKPNVPEDFVQTLHKLEEKIQDLLESIYE